MPRGSYWQAHVLCPYYKNDDGRTRIVCEGLVDNSSISLSYRWKNDFQIQMQTFCCEHFKNCEVYRMLQELNGAEVKPGNPSRCRKSFDTAYKDYQGLKRFKVSHQDKGEIRVAAPDETTALVAAAQFWQQRWQDYDFHMGCTVKAIK